MLRRRSNLYCCTLGAEAVRRVIANVTKEERESANERSKYILLRRQNDVQPDLWMRGWEHGDPVLQLLICSILNRIKGRD